MPLYFFHLQDGEFVPDRKGTECNSIAEVRQHAVAKSAAILSTGMEHFWSGTEWQITAVDEAGETVVTLSFAASTAEILQELTPITFGAPS